MKEFTKRCKLLLITSFQLSKMIKKEQWREQIMLFKKRTMHGYPGRGGIPLVDVPVQPQQIKLRKGVFGERPQRGRGNASSPERLPKPVPDLGRTAVNVPLDPEPDPTDQLGLGGYGKVAFRELLRREAESRSQHGPRCKDTETRRADSATRCGCWRTGPTPQRPGYESS